MKVWIFACTYKALSFGMTVIHMVPCISYHLLSTCSRLELLLTDTTSAFFSTPSLHVPTHLPLLHPARSLQAGGQISPLMQKTRSSSPRKRSTTTVAINGDASSTVVVRNACAPSWNVMVKTTQPTSPIHGAPATKRCVYPSLMYLHL